VALTPTGNIMSTHQANSHLNHWMLGCGIESNR